MYDTLTKTIANQTIKRSQQGQNAGIPTGQNEPPATNEPVTPTEPYEPAGTPATSPPPTTAGELVSPDNPVLQPSSQTEQQARTASVAGPAETPGQHSAETVESRLTNLLDSNSRYIQQARKNAQVTANRRGLINSSIAAGAGEKAAIESGLPIATSDASAINRFKENEQAFDMNTSLKEQEQRQTLERMDVDQIGKENLAKLSGQINLLKDNNAAALQAQLEQVKAATNITAQQKQLYSQEVSKILQSSQDAIHKIGMNMGDSGKLGMKPDQQAHAIQQVLDQRNAEIDMLTQLMQASGGWAW